MEPAFQLTPAKFKCWSRVSAKPRNFLTQLPSLALTLARIMRILSATAVRKDTLKIVFTKHSLVRTSYSLHTLK